MDISFSVSFSFKDEGMKFHIREQKHLAQHLLLLMFHKEKGSISSCHLKFLKRNFPRSYSGFEEAFLETS